MIKIFSSKHCAPCHDLLEAIKAGKVEEDVEIIDVDTDEGFLMFSEQVLKHGDGAVPSAFKDGQKCNILIDSEETIFFECPSEVSSSSKE